MASRAAASSAVQLNTVSTVQAAANALRELILDGQLEPGTRLREAEFAERLGIARHSFRAATQILIGDGMLRREPHRGVQVPVMTREDIVDTFRLRAALELEAVRIVIAARLVPDAAREAVEELTSLGDDAPWREVVEPDMRFHQAIIDATGSERIARTYAGVQAEIAMCMVHQRPLYDRPSQVAAEHEELLEVIVAKDQRRAARLFRTHLSDAAQRLSDSAEAREGRSPEKVVL
ncbi:MAG: GntR family transcriptional regulator [Solirubrobacterales bacterium]